MFDDRYGLTQAVLDGRKIMTRRVISKYIYGNLTIENNPLRFDEHHYGINNHFIKSHFPKYKIGEVVAIAQSYKDSGYYPDSLDRNTSDLSIRGLMKDSAGWNNKMFVKSYSCKHHIKIINVKLEHLQDISDEDCLKEGIYKDECKTYFNGYAFDFCVDKNGDVLAKRWYNNPREAFASLIDEVSGKGTWESNPYIFVYEFELVK